MPEPINVKCPSCDQILATADESGLVNILREHLYEEHALEMPPEREGRTSPPSCENSTATTPDLSAEPDEPPRAGGPPGGKSDRVACPGRRQGM
jgi:hypothetical protein